MKNNKISTFQVELFRNLSKNYKFITEEVFVEKGIWISFKYISEDEVYVVSISRDKNEEEVYLEVKRYLDEKGLKYNIHNIVLSKENFNSSLNNDKYYPIFIDVNSKSIVSYNSFSEPVVRVLKATLELSKPSSYKKRSFKDRIKSFNKDTQTITKWLIYSNIAIFVLSMILSVVFGKGILNSFLQISPGILYIMGAKVNSLILYDAQWWRLITAMFLHAGIVHLLFNMYALYILGNQLESILGKEKFILVYFISGIVSSLASFILSANMSVGASGAIFGLLGVLLIFAYIKKDELGFKFFKNIITVVLLNLVIGFSISNIDNAGHIGGLACGIIIGSIIFGKEIFIQLKSFN